MSDANETVRNRIEGLSESEKLNILVVGTPGTEPAAFINSMEMSVTGEWPNLRADDSGGGEQYSPRCLNRFEMFPQIEGLSGKVACLGLSLQEKEEGDISALMSRVLEGRVPTGKPVFDMSETELEQTFGGVHTGVEIDMVVFVCSGTGTVPVKVMEDAKRGVDSAKTSRNIPLFLFMVKQNNRAPTKAMKQKAHKALDISEEEFGFTSQLYQKSHTESEVSQKDAIDQPLLTFWNKILDVKNRQDKKHSPQWREHLVTICDGISRHQVAIAILFCVIIVLFAMTSRILVTLNTTFDEKVQEMKSELQNKTSEFHVQNTLNSTFDEKVQEMKSELQNMTSELQNTLNSTFDEKVHEMKSELQNKTSELQNTLSTFDGRLQEMKSELQNMTSELQNTLNSTFDKKVHEMKSELQNKTSELQNTLNSTFDEKVHGMKSELQNMTSELQNTLNSTFDENVHGMKSELQNMTSEIQNTLNSTFDEKVHGMKSELQNMTSELQNTLNSTFDGRLQEMKSELQNKTSELQNTLNSTFDEKVHGMKSELQNKTSELQNTLNSTFDGRLQEMKSELNTTWARVLLSLKNETESIALKLRTELDQTQATFNGKLEGVIRTWERKQNRVTRKIETQLQNWRTAESKLLNIVAALNASVETTEVPKEPIQQQYDETVMTRLMILCEQYPMQSLVIVAFACVAIPWLVCSQCDKRGSRRLQMAARRREGQVPGTYGDMSDDEGWLDENQQVCIVASLDWTLDEVERCVKTAVQERGLANTDVLTIRVSGQDDIDVLKRTLQRKTRVICCANSTTRNILLSDTEHDEISYVVKAAEKIVGGSGVMVLLYGHEKSRDIQQLYDSTSFDRAFLNKQTRLLNKAHRDNLFFSVFKSLNESQKHRLCDWIRGDM